MATHNSIRLVGYLLGDPKYINEGVPGGEKAIFSVRTVRRELDYYHGPKFQDVVVYYDGVDLMPKVKKLTKFDVVDIKGVFNVMTVNKRSICQRCGAVNVKRLGSSSFVYPLSLSKLNSLHRAYEVDADFPDRLLLRFEEVSNQAFIVGTVASHTEFVRLEGGKVPCCKYMLLINRKYYIPTQGEVTTDYPWVYSYGQQAESDARYLRKGSVVLVDGFIQSRNVMSTITCANCGVQYQYPDAAAEFVPYSVEYLQNYLTEADAALIDEQQAEARRRQLEGKVFVSGKA